MFCSPTVSSTHHAVRMLKEILCVTYIGICFIQLSFGVALPTAHINTITNCYQLHSCILPYILNASISRNIEWSKMQEVYGAKMAIIIIKQLTI
jgi:hypothetical protein